jgi:CsoR family transcriptional regulator, copper-sensing transcriptional repressor
MLSHYQDVKVHAQKRINIIKGQLDGLQKMIDQDVYCLDILNQSLAIQRSLKSLDAIIFERHVKTHPKNALLEMVTLFKRINK